MEEGESDRGPQPMFTAMIPFSQTLHNNVQAFPAIPALLCVLGPVGTAFPASLRTAQLKFNYVSLRRLLIYKIHATGNLKDECGLV